MAKNLLLGIDVGTYSSKAVLTTLAGEIVRTATRPHGISMPQPGHVEQDADAVWWSDISALCQQIFSSTDASGIASGITPQNVAAVAVSAIGPCLLPLDSAMQPLRPAILYGVDIRAAAEITELEQAIGAENVLAFSQMAFTSQAIGPKIRWLQKHEPEVWQKTAHLSSATAYLVYRLTGQHRMDRHTASHFMPLYNPQTALWDDKFSAAMATPLHLLPTLGWAEEPAGCIHRAGAAATGLAEGTPVAIGTIDAASEAVSVGAVHPGDLMVMYGSTTFFVLVQDKATPDIRVWTAAGSSAGQVNLAAGMGTTGSLTRWFKDQLAPDLPGDDGYAELFKAASGIPPGAGGLLVLPYFSGERTPINDTQASGVVAGLNLSHTRAHLFRAFLEGVGFGVRHNLETFAALGAKVSRVIAVGGGAQTDTWLQIVSDITGVAQVVPAVTVGASYGNAFLAGRAAGLLRPNDIQHWVKPGRVIQPNPANQALYDALYAQYLALYQGTKSVMHRLKTLG